MKRDFLTMEQADVADITQLLNVSIRLSPFLTLDPLVVIPTHCAPRYLPASSNEHLVRVEFS